MGEDSWIEKDVDGMLIGSTPMHFYISQMYFMTTTMTTIGFGEYNAAKYPYYSESDNMSLICFLQIIAIFTFSLIQDRLFSIESDLKLSEVVTTAV